jgi:hypothetical protein
MRRALLTASMAVLAAAFSAAIAEAPAAKKPPKTTSSATISASPGKVVFGSSTTIAGQLSGTKISGVTVELQAEPFGSNSFSKLATVSATPTGHYSFAIAPSLNTLYRVMAKTAPTATSSNVLVDVQVKVTLGLSTSHPASGSKVGFSGFVTPAYNGAVLIQRKTASGWKTIAHAALTAATLGRSHYSKRVTITKSGRYRARFVPPPARLANNGPVRTSTVTM